MNKIEKIGSYFRLDSQGYVQGVQSVDIDKKWKELLFKTVDFYKEQLGDDLHSVYVRGSVAKNEAIDNISDLDTFAFSLSERQYDIDPDEEFNNSMMDKYTFCTHIEIGVIPMSKLFAPFPKRKRTIWEELIKTQSICVFGEDLSLKIDPFKLEDMHGHSLYIYDEVFKKLPGYIEEDKNNNTDLEQLCSWVIRRIIRGAFDLVMEREKLFTRDLYFCYESVIKYYPKKSDSLKTLLEYAINPSADYNQWLPLVEELASWIESERQKVSS